MNKAFRLENFGDEDKNVWISFETGTNQILASGADSAQVERKSREILRARQIEHAGNPNSSLNAECAMRGLATMDAREFRH